MAKIKELLSKVFATLADCIIPILPVLIGAGMLKIVIIVFGPTVFNLIKAESGTYQVMSFAADACYYFMPIFVGIASAEHFKVNKYLGAAVGAILLAPGYIEAVEANTSLSFFGLPIVLTSYSSQILPSVIAVAIMTPIYNFLDKNIKGSLNSLLVPLLTIFIMIPIDFCLIGPASVYLSNKLVDVILWLTSIGPIGNGIMCAMIFFIVIFGLGGADLSAMLLLAATGVDPILFYANVLYNVILGAVTLALYFRNKESDALAASITAAIGGTSEPAIYGYVIKDSKAIICLLIGCFVGGLYSGLVGVKTYAMASFGMFGIITTIGPESSIIHAAIAMVLGCAVGFVTCFFTHKNEQLPKTR